MKDIIITDMKSRIQNIITKIKANPKKSVLILVIVILIGWTVGGGSGTKVEQVQVVRGTVVQEVAVTGKTVSLKDVELGFDKGGRVAFVPAQIGKKVQKGDTLAVLDNADLMADLSKAKANLAEEVVRLDEIKKTSTGTYDDAQRNLASTIRDSYTKSDDAIRNNVDRFFKNPRTRFTNLEFSFNDDNTQYNFPIDFNLRQKINNERFALESVLTEWEKSIRTIDGSKDLSAYVVEAETNLNRIKIFLNDVAYAANLIEVTEYTYESTINGYKADVSSARTVISTAISNLISAKEKVSNAPKIAEGDFSDVLAQEARVKQYSALVDSAQAQVSKTIISAPFDGLVTRQDAKVGETVTAGTSLVALIAPGEMEIEANISEVNIGKVAIGNKVAITFDAYPSRNFSGEIIYIEPAETIVDNVINYKTKISIQGDLSDIKSGLTANLRILTASRENVLIVPRYALTEEDGSQYVTRLNGKNEEKVKVEVGLFGNDGKAEIAGLSEGDIVIVGKK